MRVVDLGNGWVRRSISGTFPMHRKGWPGAWDAIKAAITGKKRRTVPVELTCSVLTKGGNALLTWGGQLTEMEHREIDMGENSYASHRQAMD